MRDNEKASKEADSECKWYCLRAQTRREHIAAGHLRALDGVAVLCPQIRYRKATRRGKVWFQEAMFPGYLFARFDRLESESMVKYSPGVSGLVHFGTKVPSVPDSFIAELQSHLQEQTAGDANGEVIILTPVVKVGDEVEVASGPLAGESGQVVQVLGARERVMLMIEILGQSQLVDVDLFSLLLPKPSQGGEQPR